MMQHKKTRITAFILAWTGGLLGLDKFYVGRTGQGIVRLVLSLSVIGLFVSVPWSYISGWVYLMDENYLPLNGDWID